MGFHHEHQRPDRDQYIKINWDQIPQSFESQFLKLAVRSKQILTDYDTESIMHYDSFGNGAFRNPALTKLDGTVIEANKKLSRLDIMSLNKLYPCKNSCENENNQSKSFYIFVHIICQFDLVCPFYMNLLISSPKIPSVNFRR